VGQKRLRAEIVPAHPLDRVVSITPKLLKNLGPIPAAIASQLRYLTLEEYPELVNVTPWLRDVKAFYLATTLALTPNQLRYGVNKLKARKVLDERTHKTRWSSDYLLHFPMLEKLGGPFPTLRSEEEAENAATRWMRRQERRKGRRRERQKRRRRSRRRRLFPDWVYEAAKKPKLPELLWYWPILHDTLKLACPSVKDITPTLLLGRMLHLSKGGEPFEVPAARLRAELLLSEKQFQHVKVHLKEAKFLHEEPPGRYRFRHRRIRECLDRAIAEREQAWAKWKQARAASKEKRQQWGEKNREALLAEGREVSALVSVALQQRRQKSSAAGFGSSKIASRKSAAITRVD
jgi:hypothetical protein